tara:strand:+ start:52 stop:288 length:237 start_codon:yes stop_codon:yes gene_type:complete
MHTLDGLLKLVPNKLVPNVVLEVADIKVISKSAKGQLKRLGGMPIPESFTHIKRRFVAESLAEQTVFNDIENKHKDNS